MPVNTENYIWHVCASGTEMVIERHTFFPWMAKAIIIKVFLLVSAVNYQVWLVFSFAFNSKEINLWKLTSQNKLLFEGQKLSERPSWIPSWLFHFEFKRKQYFLLNFACVKPENFRKNESVYCWSNLYRYLTASANSDFLFFYLFRFVTLAISALILQVQHTHEDRQYSSSVDSERNLFYNDLNMKTLNG